MELKPALEHAEAQLKEYCQKEGYRDIKKNFSVIVDDDETEKRFKIAIGLCSPTAINTLTALAKGSKYNDINIYDEEKKCFVVGIFLVRQEWMIEDWPEKVEFLEH